MPRRGRSSPMLSRKPAPAPRRPMSTAHAPPRSAPRTNSNTASKQPGLFGYMGAAVAGSAIGAAVGHTIGVAMTGSREREYEQGMAPAPEPVVQQQEVYSPCLRELQGFLQCAQANTDISMCTGLNEALRQCRLQYERMCVDRKASVESFTFS